MTDFDIIWLITAIGGYNVLVITCYIRPDDFMYIEQFTKMIMDAEDFVETHQLDGIIFMGGDLNARHETWGDSVTNRNCRLLIGQLSDEFLILNNGQPTYLCTNGHSVIDLIILYGKVADASWNLYTDADVELFTGAPNRGQILVFTEWTYINKSKPAIKRPWLDKTDWQSWTEFIEIKINSIECNTASEPWNAMLEIIQESTEKFKPTKYLSPHSKPFWNDELKKTSEDLRLLRKHFWLNSNYSNGNRFENYEKRVSKFDI